MFSSDKRRSRLNQKLISCDAALEETSLVSFVTFDPLVDVRGVEEGAVIEHFGRDMGDVRQCT